MKNQETRSRFRFGASAAAIAAALSLTAVPAALWTTQAVAQVTTSTLEGRVNGAGAGVTVTATNTNTGVSTTGATRGDGSFTIVGLRPGNYTVKAGDTPAQEITLAVGDTAFIELGDAPAASSDQGTVTVLGRRSRNVRTSEIATSVSPAQMENLPQNDRNFLNFAALAPGVSVSTGNKTFQAGGVGPDQVNVFIDGQSYKNQTSHGGVAGQSFTPGNPFPQLAVQEFKISSQNFKAEFEQSGAAIITAVTKTGGTEFHGTAFAEVTTKDMYGRPFFDRPGNANNPTGANEKPEYNRYQYGFDFGGPILKNKLHFYVAGEFNETTRPNTAVNLPGMVPQSIRDAENGEFATPFEQQLWFGKLTWFLNDADTLNFSVFKRKEDNEIDFGGNKTRSQARNVRSDTDSALLEWAHRGDGYLNEFSLAWQDARIGTPTVTDGPRFALTNGVPQRDIPGCTPVGDPACLYTGGDVAYMGAQEFEQNSGQQILTLKNDITFTSFDWHGSHVIKAGVKYSKTTLSRLEANQFNGTYFYAAQDYTGTATSPGSSQPWKATINLADPTTFEADNDQIGLYIQDDWTIDDHWTVNLGVRWDYESNMMNNKFVTPTAVVNALAGYTNWVNAGIDYRDYVSTGDNRDPFMGAIAPRLGVSYDVYGDRSLVFFAGAGRYYDRNVFLSGQIESVKAYASRIVTVEFTPLSTCTPSATCIAWQSSYSDPNALRDALNATGVGGEVWLLNNETEVPFSDNMNIGVRKRLGEINLSVSVAHNKSYNVFQYVRGNRMPDGSFSPMGDGYVIDNFPAAGILPGFSGKLNIGASNGKSKYNALFVTVEKPYTPASRYGYTATLTLADSKSTGSELGSDEFFAGPRQDVFGYNYSLGVDKLRFVASGIMDGPWDTKVSALLTLASGQPFGSIDGRGPNPPNACCIANLGGVYFPEDELAYQQLDVRIAKDFELPNGHIITADAQVYNLFDHVNRAYSAWGAGANWGGGAPLKENSTQGPARTFQVGLKYKW